MPNGNQFTLESMLEGLGYPGTATDILAGAGIQQPGEYSTELNRILGVAGGQAGELGGEYSTLLEQIGTGRQQGMRGLQEAWMTQAEGLRETGASGFAGGGARKQSQRRARRAAGSEQERLQFGYESDIFGAEQWAGGERRDLLSSLEGGITGYIADIIAGGAEIGEVTDSTPGVTPPTGDWVDDAPPEFWTWWREQSGGVAHPTEEVYNYWLSEFGNDTGGGTVGDGDVSTPAVDVTPVLSLQDWLHQEGYVGTMSEIRENMSRENWQEMVAKYNRYAGGG